MQAQEVNTAFVSQALAAAYLIEKTCLGLAQDLRGEAKSLVGDEWAVVLSLILLLEDALLTLLSCFNQVLSPH